jgi:hypothetical protein
MGSLDDRSVRLQPRIEEAQQGFLACRAGRDRRRASRKRLAIDQEILRRIVDGAGGKGAIASGGNRVVQGGIDLAEEERRFAIVGHAGVDGARDGVLHHPTVQAHLHLDRRMRAALVEVRARCGVVPGIGLSRPWRRFGSERLDPLPSLTVGKHDRTCRRRCRQREPRDHDRSRRGQRVAQVHGEDGIARRHRQHRTGDAWLRRTVIQREAPHDHLCSIRHHFRVGEGRRDEVVGHCDRRRRRKGKRDQKQGTRAERFAH